MRDNPLLDSLVAYEGFLDSIECLARAMGGEEKYGPAVYDMAHDLSLRAADATTELSFRATRARVNAIWKEFLEQQEKREER